jgi:hypothetical protein
VPTAKRRIGALAATAATRSGAGKRLCRQGTQIDVESVAAARDQHVMAGVPEREGERDQRQQMSLQRGGDDEDAHVSRSGQRPAARG